MANGVAAQAAAAMPRRLLAGLLAAALALPGAEALRAHATPAPAPGAAPEIEGYTKHPGLILTRYAVGDSAIRTAADSAARCAELGDLCAGFTCNSDATSCSVRATTMLQSSSVGEVTYQKSIDTMIMAEVNARAAAGIVTLEAAAATAAAPWVVLAPTPAPVTQSAQNAANSAWGMATGSQTPSPPPPPPAPTPPDPYLERSSAVLKSMQDVRAQELAKTQNQVQALKAGEASKIAQMRAAITQARDTSLPMVVKGAEQWTTQQVNNQAVDIEMKYLQQALADEEAAEQIRQNASATTEDALSVAKHMVELARESQDVALHLNGSHAENFTADMVSQDSQWKDISTQSQRLSMIAETVIRDAAGLANNALAAAKKAEEDAHTALDTAQTNTRRLAALKLRAEALLNLAKGQR